MLVHLIGLAAPAAHANNLKDSKLVDDMVVRGHGCGPSLSLTQVVVVVARSDDCAIAANVSLLHRMKLHPVHRIRFLVLNLKFPYYSTRCSLFDIKFI